MHETAPLSSISIYYALNYQGNKAHTKKKRENKKKLDIPLVGRG